MNVTLPIQPTSSMLMKIEMIDWIALELKWTELRLHHFNVLIMIMGYELNLSVMTILITLNFAFPSSIQCIVIMTFSHFAILKLIGSKVLWNWLASQKRQQKV